MYQLASVSLSSASELYKLVRGSGVKDRAQYGKLNIWLVTKHDTTKLSWIVKFN